MVLAETSTEDSEVLGEDLNESAIEHAMTSHDTVSGMSLSSHSKVLTTMLNEGVILTERTTIEKEIDSFTSSQLPFGMLLLHSMMSSTNQAFRPLGFDPTHSSFRSWFIGSKPSGLKA